MRALVVTLCLLALGLTAARAAETPPLFFCFVEPWDSMEQPRAIVIPNHRAGVYNPASEADILITIVDGDDQPLPGLFVEILLDYTCWGAPGTPLCVCDDADLTGYTDERGQLGLNLALGGCCTATDALEIRASGVTVRYADPIVSPDWDLQTGECEVTLRDFTAFARGYQQGLPGCSDFTGDGVTSLGDFIVFAAGWMRDCVPRER